MNTSSRATGRTAWVAIRAMALFTIVLGIGYTALVTAVGQLALPGQAAGSLLRDDSGAVVGSALVGQSFADADGAPLPEYFQPRPSAVDYNAASTGGSNFGPSNPDHLKAVRERLDAFTKQEGVTPDKVPSEMLTASGAGLDPHIPPDAAHLQAPRVALARGVPVERVQEVVRSHTESPAFGFLGRARVNVLELNLALDEALRMAPVNGRR